MNDASPILEVIVTSVEDAIQAANGGAGRLEIVREISRGGMTPSLDLVRDITEAVSVPVRIMLRESDEYGVKNEEEIETLCSHACEFSALKIDGLVLGFINDGVVDVELTQRVLSSAPNLNATFHHAFEETKDELVSIGRLKLMKQIDRLLAHGGKGDWLEKLARLSVYYEAAQPELSILAGGGLDQRRIAAIAANTKIREFHVGRAARFKSQVNGPVKSDLVRSLLEAMGGYGRGQIIG